MNQPQVANTNPAQNAQLAQPNEMDIGSAWNNIKSIVRAYRGANFEEHEWIKASMESVFNALVRGAAAEEQLKAIADATPPEAPAPAVAEAAQQPS